MTQLIALLIATLLLTTHAQADLENSDPDAHPRYSKELRFTSDGQWLPALYYGAAGAGPHPTVILLHGYPGNEKNLDVAQGLRAAGWNVLFFHYRGAWGAEGEFSFMNSEADVQAAIHFLRDDKRAAELKIDPDRIALVGHSMGGHMAIAGIFQNPHISCAVAYDGANMGSSITEGSAEEQAAWAAYGDSLFMLRGWSGAKAKKEIAANASHLNLLNHTANINGRPVLLIAADSPVIPIHRIEALADALHADGAQLDYRVMKDDHSFNNHRQELLQATQSFLDSHCR